MGKKYIIELNPDCVEGEYLRIPARIAGEEQWLMTKAALTPYTEPDLEHVRKESYEKGHEDAEEKYNDGYSDGYDAGLDDAWKAARKIGDIPYGEEEEAFGSAGWHFIEQYTASEAIAAIQKYEDSKQEYHVGDEFENGAGQKFVVLKMDGKEIDRYIDSDGKTYVMSAKYKVMRKTGRHFTEIAKVLEKMRGEQE